MINSLKQYFDEIMLKLPEKIIYQDLVAVSTSKYSSIFKSIVSPNGYLFKDINSSKLSLLCQFRLSGTNNTRI